MIKRTFTCEIHFENKEKKKQKKDIKNNRKGG